MIQFNNNDYNNNLIIMIQLYLTYQKKASQWAGLYPKKVLPDSVSAN